MSEQEQPPSVAKIGPKPTGSPLQEYDLRLTEREMQCVANGLTAFFNVATREKTTINPQQTVELLNVMEKFKAALSKGPANIHLIR